MSGAKEIRKTTRELRQAGIEVTSNGHPHVLGEQGQLVWVLPKTPGSQSSVKKSKIAAEKIIRGEPVRGEAGHHGPNTPGRLAREPQEQAPPATPERPLKERFEPESREVGPLGYSPEEIFERMPAPAPARPRRPYATPDGDPAGYARWLAGKSRPCMACEKLTSPDDLTLARCEMDEPAFIRLCTGELKMLAGKAAELAASMAEEPEAQGECCLPLCPACLQLTRRLGRLPRSIFLTLADLADPEGSRGKRVLTLTDGVPAAFRRRALPDLTFPKPSPVGMTPDVQKITDDALQAFSRDASSGSQARRRGRQPAADPADPDTFPNAVIDLHKAVTTMFRPGPQRPAPAVPPQGRPAASA